MQDVAPEPAEPRRPPLRLSAGLSPRRLLAGALTGLVVLPLLTLVLAQLRGAANLPSQTLLYLLAVVVVALVGGLVPALVAALAAAVLLDHYFIPPLGDFAVADPDNVVALLAFVLVGGAASWVVDLATRRRGAEALATANAAGREEFRRLADEQAALRRVATLVAHGLPPAEVFPAVAKEVRHVLGADATNIFRLDPDGAVTVLAPWGERQDELPVGSRWTLEPPLAIAVVLRTGRPARCDDYSDAAGAFVDAAVRHMGIQSSVAAPIVVEGRLWGVIVAGLRHGRFETGAEHRLAGFTELVGAAIANADSRDQLTASRARLVATADHVRRRIERDLHDGIQQRLVALGLTLRLTRAGVPAQLPELHTRLDQIGDELTGVIDELRELARGIHPAVLSQGGLAPALRTLARRAAIRVELDIRTDTRTDTRTADPVEVAAYYVVSEALTNTTKHAHATRAHVVVHQRDARLQLSIRDDGVGGADPAAGSGLIGLRDRVQALGGSIEITSPPGDGTLIAVELPVQAD